MPINENQQEVLFSSPVGRWLVVTIPGISNVYTEPQRKLEATINHPDVNVICDQRRSVRAPRQSYDEVLEEKHRSVVKQFADKFDAELEQARLTAEKETLNAQAQAAREAATNPGFKKQQ